MANFLCEKITNIAQLQQTIDEQNQIITLLLDIFYILVNMKINGKDDGLSIETASIEDDLSDKEISVKNINVQKYDNCNKDKCKKIITVCITKLEKRIGMKIELDIIIKLLNLKKYKYFIDMKSVYIDQLIELKTDRPSFCERYYAWLNDNGVPVISMFVYRFDILKSQIHFFITKNIYYVVKNFINNLPELANSSILLNRYSLNQFGSTKFYTTPLISFETVLVKNKIKFEKMTVLNKIKPILDELLKKYPMCWPENKFPGSLNKILVVSKDDI